MSPYRDYRYEDWIDLSDETRRTILERDWDPERPEIGEATRGAILDAFGAAHADLFQGDAEAHTVYFGNWGWCIAVAVLDPTLSFPADFAGLRVVVGVTETPDDPFQTISWLPRRADI